MEETNNPLPSNNQPPLEKVPSAPFQGSIPKKSFTYVWVILGVVILAGVAAGAYYFGQMRPKPEVQNNSSVNNNQQKNDSGGPTATPIKEVKLEDLQKIRGSTVEVEWLPELVKIPFNNTVEYQDLEYYETGKIEDGIFAGQPLALRVEGGLGMSFTHELKSLIGATNTPHTLEDLNVRIRGITDIPEEIPFPGTVYKLRKNYVNSFFKDLKISKKLFDDPILGSFYLTEDGCVVTKLPDQTAIAYDFVLPFVNKENGLLLMTFNSTNLGNQDNYIYNRITGCGAKCYYLAVIDENQLKPNERLAVVAKNSLGENIYEIINGQDQALKDLYNDKNTVAYFGEQYQPQSKNKYSYQEFLSFHPLLYWKDPLGRWVEFKNKRFEVAAEMCKPVIYLYPEKEEKLTVKVSPNGGFTFSNPKYNQGWQVKAAPEGQLTDLKTGKKYDYLFWEGIGLNYPVEDQGFVVARQDLKVFFDEKLAVLGLNEKEKTDFENYWLGRLSEKFYYKLTFLKQVQFNQLAPLDISPVKPDTVIRIMMTAEGLDQPTPTEPQVLETAPARKGFTVVEWGGVVLK